MHILLLPVEQQQSAVGIAAVHVEAVPGHQILHHAVADGAQITGDDQVIVLGRGAGVPEQGLQRVDGRRSHGPAHVALVVDAHVHHPAHGGVGEIGPVAGSAQDAAAGGGSRPLGGGAPLGAVGQGHAVLPLGGAVVRGGHGRRHVGRAPLQQHGRQRKPLAHGGTGGVQAAHAEGLVAQGEIAGGALVEQIPRQHQIHVLRLHTAPLQSVGQRPLLENGLRLLPTGLAAEGIRLDLVKIGAQRALALQLAADAAPGQHADAAGKGHRPPGSMHFHFASPHSFSGSMWDLRENMCRKQKSANGAFLLSAFHLLRIIRPR